MYMVGDLGLAARRAADAAARAKKTAAPDAAEMPAFVSVPDEKQPVQRRRRATSIMLGRGYEYMDLDQELDYPEPQPAGTASDRSAGPIRFVGSAARAGGAEPSGLATLTENQFGGSSTVPMLPSTWNKEGD
jgi:PPE-repeat protein